MAKKTIQKNTLIELINVHRKIWTTDETSNLFRTRRELLNKIQKESNIDWLIVGDLVSAATMKEIDANNEQIFNVFAALNIEVI